MDDWRDLSIACHSSYWVVELSEACFGYRTRGVPTGAVMPFNLPNGCPEGWHPFQRGASRFIVGASKTHASAVPNEDSNGNNLRARPFLKDGGEEMHLLTRDEMPVHSHTSPIGEFRAMKYTDHGGIGVRDTELAVPSSPSGDSLPHNNMPPYIALFFCEKSHLGRKCVQLARPTTRLTHREPA